MSDFALFRSILEQYSRGASIRPGAFILEGRLLQNLKLLEGAFNRGEAFI